MDPKHPLLMGPDYYSPSLDQACVGAMVLASYTQEIREGIAVDAPIEVALYWQLK